MIDTPFDIGQLNFNLDARLFKGKILGEDYNEAKLKVESIDGIMIVQEGDVRKEKTNLQLKGTIDTDLISDLKFLIRDGNLHNSTTAKKLNLPIAGKFSAQGNISGSLGKPVIKVKSSIQNFIFNKTKYGNSIFTYDNSKGQTNLQFSVDKSIDLLIALPDSTTDNIFVNLDAKQFDIAPMIGFLLSEEATRNYNFLIDGELSGLFDTKNVWNSEFSSTLDKLAINYKANNLVTQLPTNIEMKNHQIFVNKIEFKGNRQYLNIFQSQNESFKSKFIVDSQINIAYFKIFAPFFEKVDGFSKIHLELLLDKKEIQLNGSSFTGNAYLKFPGFPHAFENLSADILFNQNKILFNSLSAKMAEGRVLGNGRIKFLGPKKVDLVIHTNMDDIQLQFPEGFKTRGDASITLTGKGAPFLLTGQ